MRIKYINLKIRAVVFFTLAAAFGFLIFCLKNDKLTVFEKCVYEKLAGYINPALTNIMIFITDTGSVAAIVIIILVLLAFPFTRINYGLPIAINAIFSSISNNILKILIARDRPYILRLTEETGYGFPSGHAANNAALYAMIIFIVLRKTDSKKIQIPVVLYGFTAVFFIGISRIYLGVHNAADILAGWITGVAAALLIDTVYMVIFGSKNLIQSGESAKKG